MRLLATPEGTTASSAGLALGRAKETARTYLAALRDQGVAEKTGDGRGSRWSLVRAEPPALEPPATPGARPYLTLAALAELVVKGLVDADPGQRVVLEQAHDMIRRQRITLVKDDDGDGDAP
jgi:hypothetical protein